MQALFLSLPMLVVGLSIRPGGWGTKHFHMNEADWRANRVHSKGDFWGSLENWNDFSDLHASKTDASYMEIHRYHNFVDTSTPDANFSCGGKNYMVGNFWTNGLCMDFDEKTYFAREPMHMFEFKRTEHSLHRMKVCEVIAYDKKACKGREVAYASTDDEAKCIPAEGGRSIRVLCARTHEQLRSRGGTPWRDPGSPWFNATLSRADADEEFGGGIRGRLARSLCQQHGTKCEIDDEKWVKKVNETYGHVLDGHLPPG